MWQNLIIVIADEVSAMIDHAMKEMLFVSINGTI